MATGSPRRQHTKVNGFRYAAAVLRWIIEPSGSMDEKQRRRVRLLSAFLLLITINTLIGAMAVKNADNSSWPTMLVTAAILAAGYVLSRTGYHRLAIVLAVSIPALPIFSMALFSANRANIPNELHWLALPLLVCSFLLSLRYTIIIAIVYVAFIVLLIPFVDVPVANLSDSLAFIFMIFFFVVAVTAIRQHDQSEIERYLAERKQAEEKQQAIIKTALDGFWICNLEGKFFEVNDSYCKITGYTREELLAMSVQDIEAIEKPEKTAQRIKKIVENGADRFETQHKRKDGKIIDIEISVSYLNVEEGQLFVFVHDITERRQAEQALRESEEKFSVAFRSSPNAIAITTLDDGVFLEINDSFTRDNGYTREESIGRSSEELNLWVYPEERERILKILRDKGRVINEEYSCRSKSGEIHTMLFSAELTHVAGEPCILAVTIDISERKQAEQALKINEERFRLIADNSTDLISRIQLTPTIRTDYMSPSCLRITGYKQEEFYTDPNLGMEMIHPDDRKFFQNTVNSDKKQRQKPINVRIIRKDGRIIWIEQTHTIISNERGEPLAVHLIAHDISERKQAEQALKESGEKFSVAFRSSPEMIIIVNLETDQYIEANDSFVRTTGYSRDELIGHKSEELNLWVNKEEEEKMSRLIEEKGGVKSEEFRFRMKSGEIRTWLCSVELITVSSVPCMLAAATDITGRKRTEKLQLDENYVLTLLGQGAELSELLDAIVHLGESHDPSIKGSVLLYDPSKELLVQAAAPSLPDSYLKLLENGLPIGPNVGSCGTAAYRKERVIVADIENSPLFKPFQDAVTQATNNGLLACWSQPIIASNGDLLGTIANYSMKKDEPEAADLRILEWSARIAAIAIERKRAEEALANEAIRRRILIEQSREGIVVLDHNGNVYESNQRFAEMLGYSPEEIRHIQVWDWEFQFTPEQVLDMIQSVDETGDHFETRHRRKDGTIYDVEISTNGAVFAGEKLIFCVCRDITERKRAEEALRLSDAAFKSIHESVIVTDLEGRVTHWNEISEQLFGITASEATGSKFLDVIEIVESYPGETEDRIKKIKTQGYWQEERLYHTRSGEIWVDVHLQDIVGNGKCYGRVMLATDITQRKEAEEKLKHALSELEQSSAQLAATNKELETFSYSVSHDLRSPLRSIDGFSQAMLEDYNDKLDENGRDFLKRLRGASEKMGELIDGLLKLSRLTRSEMRKEPVDLSALAKEITSRLQGTRQGRHAKFIIEKGLSANGDPQLLRVLIENLLSNAWKFTRKKPLAKIEFGATQNNGKKTYFVKDNGAGFDMTYSDKLFGAFQRLHDNSEFPGTGIGLATVQRIINRHGGTIRAEGAVDKGATFYFTLD